MTKIGDKVSFCIVPGKVSQSRKIIEFNSDGSLKIERQILHTNKKFIETISLNFWEALCRRADSIVVQ